MVGISAEGSRGHIKQISKVVTWGHWVVGLLFAAVGIDCLFYAYVQGVPGLAIMAHGYRPNFFISYPTIILWIPLFFSTWGIWKWRRWGHVLAMVVCSFLILTTMYRFASLRASGFIGTEIIGSLIVCSILTWLLLPTVRAKYSK